jgi:hypothetical protein
MKYRHIYCEYYYKHPVIVLFSEDDNCIGIMVLDNKLPANEMS